nr:ion transporter [Butyrivibrio sp.]
MRKRIYEIVEGTDPNDNMADTYDAVMFFMTIISIAPLMFKTSIKVYGYTDIIAFIFFVIDYVLRWITADYKSGQCKVTTFVKYPFTLMAIIDLLSLLPFVTYLNSSFRILRMFRSVKTLRIFRVFRTMRHTGSMGVIIEVMHSSKKALMEVASLAVCYIIISALIIFNIEPESFNTFFDAIY